MPKYRRYSPEEKIHVAEDYLSGVRSLSEITKDLGYNYKPGKYPGCVKRWIAKYKAYGPEAFPLSSKNNSYTKEFKMMVVEKYLEGKDSLEDLIMKYKISSETTLIRWISLYNSDMELKNYNPKQEIYMADARRKTTIEELKEIVEYCISNNHDYKGTAEKYNVSYSQVYSWVRKYDVTGEEALIDRRGHHKADDELDELEKLRRENKRLKCQLEEKDKAVELLKKVQEFERRRYSLKEN